MSPDAPPSASSSAKPVKTNMPPGMIMGPDGKPCKICTAFRNWKPGNIEAGPSPGSNHKGQANGKKSTSVMMAALASGNTATAAPSPASFAPRADTPPANCPPDVEQLGRATWTFLHTTAAYYPEKPTPNQRANMLSLIRALPLLYPCSNCAEDFGEDVQRHPPDVSGRVGLSRWLCERHNEVNDKLGKDKFDCAKTDERWMDGPADGSCD